MPLARVPDGTGVGVEDGGSVHISLLARRGSGGHTEGTEEHGSEGLREHHEGREMRRLEDADEQKLRGVVVGCMRWVDLNDEAPRQ